MASAREGEGGCGSLVEVVLVVVVGRSTAESGSGAAVYAPSW